MTDILHRGQGETLGARSDSQECVLRAEEERDRERKAVGQRPLLLMSRVGSSYITEGCVKEPLTHGYLQQTEKPRRIPLSRSHGAIRRPECSPTHKHIHSLSPSALVSDRSTV